MTNSSSRTRSLPSESKIDPLPYFPELRKLLAEWYDANKRDLPWRQTDDPYRIWISEVILQQTRVEQGRDYYHRFIERFPDVHSLSLASEDEVLKQWEGLGYYSRARNLHRAARMIVSDFGGCIPRTRQEILQLPGIGDYTAAAVLSFAYDLPFAAVDGNIFRVISRLMNLDTPIDTPAGKKLFSFWADALLDREAPARHNQAIMEFGALHCTPTSPSCLLCPVRRFCMADTAGCADALPVKKGGLRITNRYLYFIYIRVITPTGVYTYIRRRPSGDIWQGLYEFPCVELSDHAVLETLLLSPELGNLLRSISGSMDSLPFKTFKHQLTHRNLWIHGYRLTARLDKAPELDGYCCIREEQLDDFAFPRALNLLLNALPLCEY
ncbi:A/G-specific adenine glycosylase [Porphyromonas gingivalis]|uniref:A/G-specific adenine glycosylase n=1 Tax=Porphyromonas gingivalis TaxID=837 RepID=UPI001F262D3F|nr:A/G-specific adenine glycosylase [Porphyromonas gingivalis]MCE8164946.1 A/G-specific adenine glycosylase [Porphyromonas gingivalis]MCE8180428.1 A/G-specific adenine glycosylase [Porphyromonas gingivalis]